MTLQTVGFSNKKNPLLTKENYKMFLHTTFLALLFHFSLNYEVKPLAVLPETEQ